MRLAVIDCGTNTFNLLIADFQPKGWDAVFSNKVSVKLGEGGINQGVIRLERMARGLDALGVHYESVLSYNCDHTLVFATSALREAENAATFVKAARARYGFEVRIIDGYREAELIFEGVRQSFELDDEYVTVMDIGGGSTEFIIGNRQGIAWKESLPLGVSRIYDLLEPEDPMTEKNIAELYSQLRQHLLPLEGALSQYPSVTLIGSSGSFDTIVDLLGFRNSDRFKRAVFNPIDLSGFEEVHREMLRCNRDERLAMKGMLPLRVDFLPLSTSMIQFLLDQFSFQALFQSQYALKEGAVGEVFSGKLKLN